MKMFIQPFFKTSESPSSRGRGLKSRLLSKRRKVGKSPSSRGRGLKSNLIYLHQLIMIVALFTRAWIEIVFWLFVLELSPVALFTRAWIEIDVSSNIVSSDFSRPLHEGVD